MYKIISWSIKLMFVVYFYYKAKGKKPNKKLS